MSVGRCATECAGVRCVKTPKGRCTKDASVRTEVPRRSEVDRERRPETQARIEIRQLVRRRWGQVGGARRARFRKSTKQWHRNGCTGGDGDDACGQEKGSRGPRGEGLALLEIRGRKGKPGAEDNRRRDARRCCPHKRSHCMRRTSRKSPHATAPWRWTA